MRALAKIKGHQRRTSIPSKYVTCISRIIVVYLCKYCHLIGYSTRYLIINMRAQHITFNKVLTGRPSSSPVMSSILSHLNSTGHSANFDDFKILSSCSETYELMSHERLLISKLKTSLNVQGSSIPLNLLKFYCFMSVFCSFVCIVFVMFYLIPSYPSSFLALCNIILCKYILTSSCIYSLM